MGHLSALVLRVLQVAVVAISLVFVSVALAPADYRGELIYLGTGGCRTTDGGHGTCRLQSNVSLLECKGLCYGKGPCAAVEYNKRKRECEVHSARITGVSAPGSGETTCWRFQ